MNSETQLNSSVVVIIIIFKIWEHKYNRGTASWNRVDWIESTIRMNWVDESNESSGRVDWTESPSLLSPNSETVYMKIFLIWVNIQHFSKSRSLIFGCRLVDSSTRFCRLVDSSTRRLPNYAIGLICDKRPTTRLACFIFTTSGAIRDCG